MQVKQTPISQAVFVVLLGASGAVMAQQAPAQTQLDTVVVTGIRAAQEKALSVKRNADAHIDVITAEDIGKMPDKNVADSLAPSSTTNTAWEMGVCLTCMVCSSVAIETRCGVATGVAHTTFSPVGASVARLACNQYGTNVARGNATLLPIYDGWFPGCA